MKKGLILWILATVCGCTGYQVSRVPQPKGTYIPAIYAAGQIAHGPTRSQAFRDLAYHKDMTKGELEYMISLLAIRKGTSQQLKDILLTILNNPAATAPMVGGPGWASMNCSSAACWVVTPVAAIARSSRPRSMADAAHRLRNSRTRSAWSGGKVSRPSSSH